ncbi:MAG: carotenoid oxygenase family protein [Polyangiaceae bacterium]|nr:carotenoid oxygenase family protein [Polyangiaceae bacterium]
MTRERATLPFHLTGAYAPVHEERTVFDLDVQGAVPAELCGTYVRNGPNPRAASPAWFVGEGMIHGVRLENGGARWYRNRWVGPNTSVVRHAGRILALVEGALPVEVDEELETIGKFDFGGDLPRAMIAHPKACPETGELFFLSYGRERPHLVVYRADARGRIVHRNPVDVPAMTYMHDMAITARHVVFWDMPVLVDDWHSPQPMRWADDYRPRIGVVARDGKSDDVMWFDVKPAFISHAMNAFVDGDTVVLDVVRAPRTQVACALYRYTLDLSTGRATERIVDDRFIDFPRIPPSREGRPYRHGYGVELSDWATGSWQRAVAHKCDMTTGASVAHDFGPARLPGEFVLAPRPGSTREGREDDAWAIAFVYDRQREASDLVILDAERFGEPPVATVRLPFRVPVGIHGAWVPDSA